LKDLLRLSGCKTAVVLAEAHPVHQPTFCCRGMRPLEVVEKLFGGKLFFLCGFSFMVVALLCYCRCGILSSSSSSPLRFGSLYRIVKDSAIPAPKVIRRALLSSGVFTTPKYGKLKPTSCSQSYTTIGKGGERLLMLISALQLLLCYSSREVSLALCFVMAGPRMRQL